MVGLGEATVEEFTRSILPLFNGPRVTVQVRSSDWELAVSKALLCHELPYFSAMFDGKFSEAQKQTAVLEDIEGVVSEQSLEALVQWLYMGKVKFSSKVIEDPARHISAIIEFVRIADMCGVTGMDYSMGQELEDILLANPAPLGDRGQYTFDHSTCLVLPEHIVSAERLPNGHHVRRVLAKASVSGFLRDSKRHKFASEVNSCPKFAGDVLKEVAKTLGTVRLRSRHPVFKDPMTGEEFELNGGNIFNY